MPTDALQRGLHRNGESGPGDGIRPLPGGSRRVTVLGAVLMALAAAFAVRLALSGDMRLPASAARAEAAGSGTVLGERLAMARAAEEAGDVESALAHYRAAAGVNPRIVDKAAPEFLGPRFEATIRDWVSGLRSGRIAAGPSAARDAAYLFRRMYGGCG